MTSFLLVLLLLAGPLDLAREAMRENRLGDAEELLNQSSDPRRIPLLAEIHDRQDRLDPRPSYGFYGQQWFNHTLSKGVPPAITVEVMGSLKLTFLIDLNQSQTVIGVDQAKRAEVKLGRLPYMRLCGWGLNDIPVKVVSASALARLARGREVDGIVGTAALSHLSASIQFPTSELSLGLLTEPSPQTILIPFGLENGKIVVAAGESNIEQIVARAAHHPYYLTVDFERMKLRLDTKQSWEASWRKLEYPEKLPVVMRQVIDAYNAADYHRIWTKFDARLRVHMPQARLKEWLDELKSTNGPIVSLNFDYYLSRVLSTQKGPPLEMVMTIDDTDRITTLDFPIAAGRPQCEFLNRGCGPNSPYFVSSSSGEPNATHLRLPFRGRWIVTNGGDRRAFNSHDDAAQFYGFDFAPALPGSEAAGRENLAPALPGSEAAGREILAPADGVVSRVTSTKSLGNAIFIEHAKNEVSVLANLQAGSMRVKVGDQVKAGQFIALCAAPHLHYHLQRGTAMEDAEGIRVGFDDLIVDHGVHWVQPQHYSPIKGEALTPASGSRKEVGANRKDPGHTALGGSFCAEFRGNSGIPVSGQIRERSGKRAKSLRLTPVSLTPVFPLLFY